MTSNPFPGPTDLPAELNPQAPEPAVWPDELDELYAKLDAPVAAMLRTRWQDIAPGLATYEAEVKTVQALLALAGCMRDASSEAKRAVWQVLFGMADALMREAERGEAAWGETRVVDHQQMVLRQSTAEGASKGGRARAEKRQKCDAARNVAICAAWTASRDSHFDSLRKREEWVSEQAPKNGPPWTRSTIRRVVQKAGLVRVWNGPRA